MSDVKTAAVIILSISLLHGKAFDSYAFNKIKEEDDVLEANIYSKPTD